MFLLLVSPVAGCVVSAEPVAVPEEFDLPVVVLVVEDEVLIRMDLSDELREAGFTVYEAGTADSAMELLQTPARIDVVVTDVRMPGKHNGIDLAAFIRKNLAGIKVVVMSGDYRPEGDDGRLMDGFFAKPFEPRLLVKTIEGFRSGTSWHPDHSL